MDPAHQFAWGENIGWTNWHDAGDPDEYGCGPPWTRCWTNWHDAGDPDGAQGVRVEDTFLSGFIWAENVGWINLGDGTPANSVEYANVDGTDFGVNRHPDTDELYGYAWGENIGWINFEGGALASPPNPARVDLSNCTLAGYVWGENVGWINLDDATAYVGLEPAVCAAGTVGDLNCDGAVDFGDINPFVKYVANCATWQATYPGCPANIGDIDGDGLHACNGYPFDDINAFVALLSGGR